MPRLRTIRVEFSRTHDSYLTKYLANHCPSKEGRSGHKIFERLVANEQNLWPWSVHHTWQSWRTRYVKNADLFDRLILNYQRKHNIKAEGKKRPHQPMPIEMLEPNAKRIKLDVNERVSSSETPTEHSVATPHANSSTSVNPRQPQETPPIIQPPVEPEPAGVPPSTPPRSSANAVIDATKKPSLDIPALQTRHDTLEIPSPSPSQVPPPTDAKPDPRSPPRAVKRPKERPRAPSEPFASEPPSPRKGSAVIDVGDAPVTDPVCSRAPPRVVDSLHGQVLVDQQGHVPRALPHGGEGEAEEEETEEEEEAKWPPARGRTAKLGRTSGQGVEVDTHHAFSQPQPQLRPEAPVESVAMGERGRGKSHHSSGHVSRTLGGARLDRRTAAALFSDGVHRNVAPRESERCGDVIQNGASPVMCVAPPAPAPPALPAPPASPVPPPPAPPIPIPAPDQPPSKALKFPAPRSSTRSPFRPEPPTGKTHHPSPRPQARAKTAHHPTLTRIRRQTIGYGNGIEYENRQVPSLDLVELSRASTSTRSYSHSSVDGSVPTAARPSRWSLPAFGHTPPWVLNEPRGAPSALSAAGSMESAYSDIWRNGSAKGPSLAAVPTPRFMFTPSPTRSLTVVGTNADADASALHLGAIASPSLTLSVAPHSVDVPLVASHGLASILAHMSVNHGLALGVVEAVYARVGSLREADEVLRGMREAAEGFGEREIERRVRERGSGAGREEKVRGRRDEGGKGRERAEFRYVVTSEEGEGSEYSPPETSRAAMWKKQSESVTFEEEREEEKKEREEEEEEEEERRATEELVGEDEASDEDEPCSTPHDFSKRIQEALLENLKAQELEREMGKGLYRKRIVRQFV